MKTTRTMWDMPVTVEIHDHLQVETLTESIYAYFRHVNDVFNTFIDDSEISRVNRGDIPQYRWSTELTDVLTRCDETSKMCNGYFSYVRDGKYFPLGLVKGWAITQAAHMLDDAGVKHFYIDAGGDIEVRGRNTMHELWRVGIRSPFRREEIVKVLRVTNCGVATSGTYVRGDHIYNPHTGQSVKTDVVSLTVIGPSAYEADRFATPAFAMGEEGISFIASRGLQGYQINKRGIATFTSAFD